MKASSSEVAVGIKQGRQRWRDDNFGGQFIIRRWRSRMSKRCLQTSSLFPMTRRIIVSVRDTIQLGFDKLNVVAKQFSGNTSQAVGNMTLEKCCKVQDIHVRIFWDKSFHVSMTLGWVPYKSINRKLGNWNWSRF